VTELRAALDGTRTLSTLLHCRLLLPAELERLLSLQGRATREGFPGQKYRDLR
jgi:hypothetical protein